jgi:hypothetical protein
MKPHIVIVSSRFERMFWLVIGVSVVLFGGLTAVAAALLYLIHLLTFGWLNP